MKKKITALLLAAAVITALLPGTVTLAATSVSRWDELQTAFSAGGEITLACDIIADAADTCLTVPAGVAVTLDLNGKAINRNLTTAKADGQVIRVLGTLTVNDSSDPSTGQIRGGFSNSVGAFRGAGVHIATGGVFTLNGGSICYNSMPDGTTAYGAGVSVENEATFTMNGGSIDHNSSGWFAGGVVVRANGIASLLGGRITDNTCYLALAAGVYAYGHLTVGGDIVIKDNIARNYNRTTGEFGDAFANNLETPYYPVTISADEPLTDGADVHCYRDVSYDYVTIANSPGGAAYAKYFTSDRSDRVVCTSEDYPDRIYLGTLIPVLTAGDVSRTSLADATVKFTSSIAGQYYYSVVDGGALRQYNRIGLDLRH